MRRRSLALATAAALTAGAAGAGGVVAVRSVGSEGPSPSRIATDRPCPEAAAPTAEPLPDGVVLALEPVGRADQPTSAAFLPDGSGHGALGERRGRVRRVEAGRLTDEVVLDLSHDTMDEGDGGLLALAFSPDGDWLYVYRADGDRDDVLTAHRVDPAGRPTRGHGVVLLHVDHPDSVQHHGGGLAVTPDGGLFLGLGDGGGLGDPRGNAQDPGTLLGKLLRIEPTPGGPRPYLIPPDNPYVSRPGWRGEIWTLGVRNPFRLTYDPPTGDLWLGDVGQSCWEELDRVPTDGLPQRGLDLGWDRREGSHRFEGGEGPGEALDPEQEHNHREGWCGIVAGIVHRDAELPALDGRLLYTDYCRGRLMALTVDAAVEPRLVDTGLTLDHPTAIVAGPAGEPWVLSLDGAVMALVARRG